jgi:hypothetical protein
MSLFLIIIIVIILSGCEQKKFNIKYYTDEKNIEEVVNEFMSVNHCALRSAQLWTAIGNRYDQAKANRG